MKHDIVSALRSLAPGAEWAISGGELLWHNGNGHDQPTEDAINAKIIELDTAEAMKLLRKKEIEELQRLIGEHHQTLHFLRSGLLIVKHFEIFLLQQLQHLMICTS